MSQMEIKSVGRIEQATKHSVCRSAWTGRERESDSFEPVDTMYLHKLPRTDGEGV